MTSDVSGTGLLALFTELGLDPNQDGVDRLFVDSDFQNIQLCLQGVVDGRVHEGHLSEAAAAGFVKRIGLSPDVVDAIREKHRQKSCVH